MLLHRSDIPRLPQPLPRALAPDVDAALMHSVSDLDDPTARCGITLLRGTGLRIGELLDLELDCLWDLPRHARCRGPAHRCRRRAAGDQNPARGRMASIWALLPADDAATVWAAITAHAEAGRLAADGHRTPDLRTADQRRADALTGLTRDYLTRPTTDPVTGQPGQPPKVPG